jgi:hypothetical protein
LLSPGYKQKIALEILDKSIIIFQKSQKQKIRFGFTHPCISIILTSPGNFGDAGMFEVSSFQHNLKAMGETSKAPEPI